MTLPTFIAFGMATAFALGIAAAAVSRRLDVRARSAPRQRGAEPVTESDQRVVFHGADMAALQRHFTALLMIVSHHGSTAGTVERMREAHGAVRDEAGKPITPAVYDDVISVLAGVLAREGVPFATIRQLARTVLPLREAIAVPNRGDETGPIPPVVTRSGDPEGRSEGCHR